MAGSHESPFPGKLESCRDWSVHIDAYNGDASPLSHDVPPLFSLSRSNTRKHTTPSPSHYSFISPPYFGGITSSSMNFSSIDTQLATENTAGLLASPLPITAFWWCALHSAMGELRGGMQLAGRKRGNTFPTSGFSPFTRAKLGP